MTLFMLSCFHLLSLLLFGVKPLSWWFTRSTGCLLLSLIITHLTRGCLALFSLITIFVSLDLCVFFYSNHISAPNLSLILSCVAFLGMEWHKRAIGVMSLHLPSCSLLEASVLQQSRRILHAIFSSFTTLLETPLSPTPTDDIFSKPSSLEQHLSNAPMSLYLLLPLVISS